jgi:hypothetical protein
MNAWDRGRDALSMAWSAGGISFGLHIEAELA